MAKEKTGKEIFDTYIAPSLKEARKRMTKDTNNFLFEIDDRYIDMGIKIRDRKLTYMVKTYGCQGNLADSEKICGIMDALKYTEVDKEEKADVIFFNTCAIRENAENRIYGELGRLKNLKKRNRDLLIALCGCMPQEEVTIKRINESFPQVDIVFGTHNIHKIPELLYKAYKSNNNVFEVMSIEGDIVEGMPQKRISDIKAWVDIMYGCDEFCTYCIVPYTRGKERSRRPEAIINEVKELVEKGYKEITLLGQNVNAYGKDFVDIKYSFANLLEDLAKTNIPRIRYTTSHPRDLDKDTMDVMGKYENIMPHLHLPVQSGSDKILKKMNRKYTKEIYLEKINYLKKQVPGLALTTDIIVGFPYEDEDDYNETLDLVRKADFEGAYTFIYSPRAGTPAATYEQIDEDVSKARLLKLNELINEGFAKGNKRFENSVVEVLVDGFSDKNPEMLCGYTKHNKLVNFEGDVSLIGKFVNVYIDKAYTWHLHGTLKSDALQK
ncbi:MAG: tRNA (N6-isopentenyl adenosine(37)-C2)-methylthiotransferase MiaB [Bacilli bacterium]|nr:tRNA (N6-isopentenyl adenosine(37)-C2)-methylthiotransferase MiaB [Bacilli bacterium]